jgi:hypothetical protein
VAYAKELVRWLEFHGAEVVNGSRVLDVECSKALQMMYCAAAGLNTPSTTLQHGLRQTMVQAAVGYRDSPLIMKPNHGGSGTNVDAYTNGRDLQHSLRYSRIAPSPGDQWVIQTLLGSFSRDPTVTKSILRFEVVDGVVQRDYVVKITAPSAEFSLCPCDPRTEKILNSISFRILANPLTVPGFKEDPEVFDAFCKKVELAFALIGAKVGSVEAIVLWQDYPEQAKDYPHPKEPVIFEMNFSANYNPTAESAAEIRSGVSRICDMLVAMCAGERPTRIDKPGPVTAIGRKASDDTCASAEVVQGTVDMFEPDHFVELQFEDGEDGEDGDDADDEPTLDLESDSDSDSGPELEQEPEPEPEPELDLVPELDDTEQEFEFADAGTASGSDDDSRVSFE